MSLFILEDKKEITQPKKVPKKHQCTETKDECTDGFERIAFGAETLGEWKALVTDQYYNVKKFGFGPCVANYEKHDEKGRHLACRPLKIVDRPATYGVDNRYLYSEYYSVPFVSQVAERLDCAIIKIQRVQKGEMDEHAEPVELDPSEVADLDFGDGVEVVTGNSSGKEFQITYALSGSAGQKPKICRCLLSKFKELVRNEGSGGMYYKCYNAYSIKFRQIINND